MSIQNNPNVKVQSPGPKSEEWLGRRTRCLGESSLLRLFPGFIPFKAEGAYVTDTDGNRYLDFSAQRINVGHAHPRLVKAVTQQIMDGGFYVGEPSRIKFAEKLKEVAPGALSKGMVGLARGATPAVERTILMIRRYTKRRTLFALQGSFHGSELASVSISFHISSYRKGLYPMLPDVVYAPFANCYRCPFGLEYPNCGLQCAKYIQYVFDTVAHPEDVAALFFEPIQVQGGMVIPPDEYLKQLRKICDEYQILLVDDEVITGMGRTGRFFGTEHSGITPDILIMGKPIANGLDFAATIGSEEVMKHGHFTYGSPIASIAATETINIILEEKLEENAREVGEYMMKRLKEIQESYEIIGDVRGKGLLVGIELVTDLREKTPATKETREIVTEAYRKGLLMVIGGAYGQVIRLTPPLNITMKEVDKALEILEEVLKEV